MLKIMLVFLNDRKRTLIPINLSVLKAALEKGGFETRIFDTSFYAEHERFAEEDKKENAGIFKKINYEELGLAVKKTSLVDDFLKDLEAWRPDLVAFSVYSSTYDLGVRLATALKKKHRQVKTLFGGIHVSISPEEVIKDPSVDMICIGEGEEAFPDLLGGEP